MGAKAIIRQGDPTSHHGTVLEGHLDTILFGKPVAGVGHKVHCPKCHGSFPIVEGAISHSIMGKSTAVEGMKTSCGAILIATQHTDTIDDSRGASGTGTSSSGNSPGRASTSTPVAKAQKAAASESTKFNDKFQLIDEETNEPLARHDYAIKRANGTIEHGTTDGDGNTHLLSSTVESEDVDIYA